MKWKKYVCLANLMQVDTDEMEEIPCNDNASHVQQQLINKSVEPGLQNQTKHRKRTRGNCQKPGKVWKRINWGRHAVKKRLEWSRDEKMQWTFSRIKELMTQQPGTALNYLSVNKSKIFHINILQGRLKAVLQQDNNPTTCAPWSPFYLHKATMHRWKKESWLHSVMLQGQFTVAGSTFRKMSLFMLPASRQPSDSLL